MNFKFKFNFKWSYSHIIYTLFIYLSDDIYFVHLLSIICLQIGLQVDTWCSTITATMWELSPFNSKIRTCQQRCRTLTKEIACFGSDFSVHTAIVKGGECNVTTQLVWDPNSSLNFYIFSVVRRFCKKILQKYHLEISVI